MNRVIPICSFCSKVRTDDGRWQHLEDCVRGPDDAGLSHSVCPACMRVHYPDLAPGPQPTD